MFMLNLSTISCDNQTAIEEITADGELHTQFLIREQREEYYINTMANLYEKLDKLNVVKKVVIHQMMHQLYTILV